MDIATWILLVNFFIEYSAMPNDGGLLDQDLRFFIALQIIAPEVSKKMEGGMPGGKGGMRNKISNLSKSFNF